MVVMQLSNCVLTPVKVTTGESLLTVLFPQTGFCVNSSFLILVFFFFLQDNVLNIINQIMDECIPNDRANRDFSVKFPEEIRHDNLAGQLWFGAEVKYSPLFQSQEKQLQELEFQTCRHVSFTVVMFPADSAILYLFLFHLSFFLATFLSPLYQHGVTL